MGNPGGCEAVPAAQRIGIAVLDAYIIEEIKRQEDERRQREHARPRLRIEIPRHREEPTDKETSDEEADNDRDRGSVIRIDL